MTCFARKLVPTKVVDIAKKLDRHDHWSIAGNRQVARLSIEKTVCAPRGRKEARMSLATTIVLLICGWLAVAGAMLWGVLRITRRHHPPHVRPAAPAKPHKVAAHHA